ncbi:complexin-1 [Loxodonta africana]|uniref:complexin-1 n=1 Tax=Loxodonta africana TaxID=9785 RepID=UPI0030D4ADB8
MATAQPLPTGIHARAKEGLCSAAEVPHPQTGNGLFWAPTSWELSQLTSLSSPGATKDMGKMLGGDEEKDPDAAKKEEERQEALRQEEEERKAKYAKMEAEREVMRQGIRDKYGIKKKEEREAEAQAAMEANSEGSLTRPKKAIPPGCGDEPEEEDESILDTVIKYLPGPLQDMFRK